MKLNRLTALFFIAVLSFSFMSCEKEEVDDDPINDCCMNQGGVLLEIDQRNFKMGFTSWPYNDQLGGQDTTYNFLKDHGDIYAEHIDDKIPWSAWINNTALPQDFINNIQGRKQRKIAENELLVSVSLLNNLRTDLAEDFNGDTLTYDSLNQSSLVNAYFKHLDYITTELKPDYLVIAMEVNELYLNNQGLWEGYKKLMDSVRLQMKAKYPNLKMSESLTIHNLAYPKIPNWANYSQEMISYINANVDFATFSFHPHIGGLNSVPQFKQGFDYVADNIQKPIAFVETSSLAEDLINSNLNLNIPASEASQQAFLEIMLVEAHREDYEFIIWWCHRDYDALWATFPPSVKDLGQLWRDTGLLDEDGNPRSAYEVWEEILIR